jgi:hypothetical protein
LAGIIRDSTDLTPWLSRFETVYSRHRGRDRTPLTGAAPDEGPSRSY